MHWIRLNYKYYSQSCPGKDSSDPLDISAAFVAISVQSEGSWVKKVNCSCLPFLGEKVLVVFYHCECFIYPKTLAYQLFIFYHVDKQEYPTCPVSHGDHL